MKATTAIMNQFVAVMISIANAVPVMDRDSLMNDVIRYQEKILGKTSTKGHVIYSIIGFMSIVTVTAMFSTISLVDVLTASYKLTFKPSASRNRTLKGKSGQLIFIRSLVNAVYICALCFLITTGIFLSGWDLSTTQLCRSAIDLCLVFYIGHKVILYFFLLERIRQFKKPIHRHQDIIWIFGTIVILTGFGTIAVFAFLDPVTGISDIDGKCRIGLPFKTALPLLVFDILVNFFLTSVFVSIGLKQFRRYNMKRKLGMVLYALPAKLYRRPVPRNAEGVKDLYTEVIIAKSLVGAISIIVPTSINLAIFLYVAGHEKGWLCFSICTIDVVWSTIIIHWLTGVPTINLANFIHPSTLPAITNNGEYLEMN